MLSLLKTIALQGQTLFRSIIATLLLMATFVFGPAVKLIAVLASVLRDVANLLSLQHMLNLCSIGV